MAVAFSAGLFPERVWIVQAALVVAMGQGIVAGTALPSFWRGPPSDEIFGAGGRYLGFLAAVAFSGVEAYAVGRALAAGAPGGVWLLLVPPLLVAAVALSSALRHVADPERGDPASEVGGEVSEEGGT